MSRAKDADETSEIPELDRCARATADLDLDAGFTDALMAAIDEPARGKDFDGAALAAATSGVAPTDGFTNAVMGRVERLSLVREVERAGPFALFVAAAAVAASVFFFVDSQSSFDESVVTTLDPIEVDE